MSSLPLLLSLIDELDRETYNPSYYGNDFGLGLHPQHIHRREQQLRHREPTTTNLVGYTLPLNLLSRLGDQQQLNRRRGGGDGREAGGKVVGIGKDGFQVNMDVGQFKPNELTVKVVDSNVVVEGKHEEREDEHGHIFRHFVRRYALPKGYDADKVISTLSSDGVLTISVPKPQLEDKSNERVVQIQQTGPAHLNVKKNTDEVKSCEDGAKNGSNGDGAEK